MARKAAKRSRRTERRPRRADGARSTAWWQAASVVEQRDANGALRHLAHLQTPFADAAAASPEALVVSYLRSGVGAAFGMTPDQLDRLAKQLPPAPPDQGIAEEFQFVRPARAIRRGAAGAMRLETTVVTIKQALLLPSIDPKQATDIWQSGLRIAVVHGANGGMRIYGAGGSVRTRARIAPNPIDSQFFKEFSKDLLTALLKQPAGLIPEFRTAKYVLPADARNSAAFGAGRRDEDIPIWGVFIGDHSRGESLPRRLFVAAPGVVVAIQDLVSCAVGSVFTTDPLSRSGNRLRGVENVGVRPSLPSDTLDYWREDVTLRGNPSRNAATGRIVGDLVQLVPYHPTRTQLPAPDAAGDYRWSARTDGRPGPNDPTRIDGFAATGAYHHCDAMFRLVERFGFALDDYFRPEPFTAASRQFPLTVYPRAAIVPGPAADGHSLGGQVMQDTQFKFRTADLRFALADLADPLNPLGITADNRWVWHEFAHVLLIAGQDALEFEFAHSMGDALAAMLCDTESEFGKARMPGETSGPWGLTFPWELGELRRHDRAATDGWSWNGSIYSRARYPRVDDPWGYWAEQLMSSSLFRLYRALGGDARQAGGADLGRRRTAARQVAYLIVRAAKQLADASIAPVFDATEFAADLQAADIATPLLDYRATDPADPTPSFQRIGGTLPKIIRWSFERQGLYPRPGMPPRLDGLGAPPAVDVYIDDGRRGAYDFAEDWQATRQALWLRRLRDGGTADQKPKARRTNYVYLRLGNRGFAPAVHCQVEVYAVAPGGAATWSPAQWTRLKRAPGGGNNKTIKPGKSASFGPFEWAPPVEGNYTLVVKASAPGDLPNVDVPGYPCATAAAPLAELVPYDNNLGLRAGIVAVR